MRICEGLEHFQPPRDGVVLSIGNFDGVHLGHRCLVDTAREAARELGVPVVTMTFEPHPLAVVAPERMPARLTTLPEKAALLAALDSDITIVLHSTRELLSRGAEQFLVELVERCRPRVIVEGPTFNFGRGREGSVDTLREFAPRLGFELRVVDELHSNGLADNPGINSSAIRKALQAGRLADANAMLGRAYRICGTVGHGDSRGATLGYPTANLGDIPHLLPHEAVYAAVAQFADGSLHLAAVNIGPQPTFEQEETRVEAYVLDYSGDLRGRQVGLYLLAKIREQTRFGAVDELTAQLARDVEQTRSYAPELERLRSRVLVSL